MSSPIQIFNRVEHLANATKLPATPENAAELATCYLLACERTGNHHHPEDNPSECFDHDYADSMQNAHDAVWKVIGEANTKNPLYVIAWAVWGVLLEENMGQGAAESTI